MDRGQEANTRTGCETMTRVKGNTEAPREHRVGARWSPAGRTRAVEGGRDARSQDKPSSGTCMLPASISASLGHSPLHSSFGSLSHCLGGRERWQVTGTVLPTKPGRSPPGTRSNTHTGLAAKVPGSCGPVYDQLTLSEGGDPPSREGRTSANPPQA